MDGIGNERWRVVRLDDNGHRFVVVECQSQAEAQRIAEEMADAAQADLLGRDRRSVLSNRGNTKDADSAGIVSEGPALIFRSASREEPTLPQPARPGKVAGRSGGCGPIQATKRTQIER